MTKAGFLPPYFGKGAAMFEEESIKWATRELGNGYVDDIDNHSKTFQKGAEFGYNEAMNEIGYRMESAYSEGVAFGRDNAGE